MNKKLNNRVVLYMRYSSNAQDDGNSIEAQRKALYKYVADNNLEVVEEYVDKAKTGTNSNRPEFIRMMSDSKKNKFDIVLVHKFDRFSRSRYDSVVNKLELSIVGVELISVTEQFGDTPEAKVMEGISEVFNEFYSANLSRETKKGLDINASKGLHNGGSAPLGYDVVDKKLAINEEEAVIVREIFSLYANGYTYNQIAKEMNLKGYHTKAGNPFSASSFNSILHQRKYIGEYVYNLRASKAINGKCNSHKHKDEDEVVRIPDAVPRIIDDITFNKVQDRLSMNRKRTYTYKADTSYLLAGKVICGECGQHYQGNSRCSGGRKHSVYSSYRCGNRQNHKTKDSCTNGEIEKNRLEQFVVEQLRQHLINEKSIKAIRKLVLDYNLKVKSKDNQELQAYKKSLKTIKKEIANLTLAISKGVIEDSVIEELNKKSLMKKDIEDKLSKLEQIEMPEVSESTIKKALSKFDEYVLKNNRMEIKNFINEYVDKVIIYKDRVEVIIKIASAIFCSSTSTDLDCAVIITTSISREELKQHPKQKRRILLQSNSLKHFDIVISNKIVFHQNCGENGELIA